MNPSKIYPFLYDFLLKCGHAKTARVFLKDIRMSHEQAFLEGKDDLINIFTSFRKSAKLDYESGLKEKKRPTAEKSRKEKESESKSSEDSSEDSSDACVDDSSDDSSDESSDDSSDDSSADSSDDSSSDEDNSLIVQKKEMERKRKAEEAKKASELWMKNLVENPTKRMKSSSTPKTPGEAFKRVDAEVWNKEILDGLHDNSYGNQFGQEGYGARASAQLIRVKGRDFRHEKTKKKRGSYRGGAITLESNSFKY